MTVDNSGDCSNGRGDGFDRTGASVKVVVWLLEPLSVLAGDLISTDLSSFTACGFIAELPRWAVDPS